MKVDKKRKTFQEIHCWIYVRHAQVEMNGDKASIIQGIFEINKYTNENKPHCCVVTPIHYFKRYCFVFIFVRS